MTVRGLDHSSLVKGPIVQEAFEPHEAQQSSGRGESKEAASSAEGHQATVAEHIDQAAPAELLQGTEMAVQPAQSATTAAGVMMPSVEQLQAAQAPDALAAEGHQSTGLVARVLAEALDGGAGDGPDLDALISALGGEQAGHSGLAQVAVQAAHSFGSSGWEAADYAGAATAHANFGMDALNLHQDAIPQV